MALATSTILGIVGAATAAVGTVQAQSARKEANRNAEAAAAEQRKAQGEQKAASAEAAATERRQQIREERVRRARIIQSAENTGTAESSGEIGALGVLSTNLSVGLGANVGAVARGGRISGNLQSAADFNFAAESAMGDAKNADAIAGFGGTIFQASGGFSNFSGLGKKPVGTDNSIFGTAGSGSRSMGD